ncbi:hypothetical protein DIPPA_27787 [Diplonema papillatum]|nr:hypothetical protein DIPPA_27787 [Diplonema papillatum]|eukprot:gene8216-12679_t
MDAASLWQKEADRLKRALDDQQHEILAALGEAEVQRSRANDARVAAAIEIGAKWQRKFEDYKREVLTQYRRDLKYMQDTTSSRQVDVDDRAKLLISELEADLKRERTIKERQGDRLEATEAELAKALEDLEKQAELTGHLKKEHMQAVHSAEALSALCVKHSDKAASLASENAKLKADITAARKALLEKQNNEEELEARCAVLQQEMKLAEDTLRLWKRRALDATGQG